MAGTNKSEWDNVSFTSSSDDHVSYMNQALRVARAALEMGEVPVGCIIVLRTDLETYDSGSGTGGVETEDALVIVSHGANQVNACRDATRHAEIVAIDRMLTAGRSSDQLRLPLSVYFSGRDVPHRSNNKQTMQHIDIDDDVANKDREKYWKDRWINNPHDPGDWRNSHGWNSRCNTNIPQPLYTLSDLKHCRLYVTCEPCIMCAAAIRQVGISQVYYGCRNDKFGGCGSLLHLHKGMGKDFGIANSPSESYHVEGGIMEHEAISLLRSFYDRENFHAPDDKRKRKDKCGKHAASK